MPVNLSRRYFEYTWDTVGALRNWLVLRMSRQEKRPIPAPNPRAHPPRWWRGWSELSRVRRASLLRSPPVAVAWSRRGENCTSEGPNEGCLRAAIPLLVQKLENRIALGVLLCCLSSMVVRRILGKRPPARQKREVAALKEEWALFRVGRPPTTYGARHCLEYRFVDPHKQHTSALSPALGVKHTRKIPNTSHGSPRRSQTLAGCIFDAREAPAKRTRVSHESVYRYPEQHINHV